jgi:hypothetical protein
VDWIHVDQDRYRWGGGAVVNSTMNHREGNFSLISFKLLKKDSAPFIVAVTKLYASRSKQNRTTLQHEQRSTDK